MRLFRHAVLGAVLSAGIFLPAQALACGGFFCNQSQPVNQAAEGIIFADNGDGTTTAVIQIMYEGPSESFSWLLPISSVPDAQTGIGVASNLAFQRLQSATNPSYTLTTRVEGTCKSEGGNLSGGFGSSTGGSGNFAPGNPSVGLDDGGVNVEAAGVVGAFDWVVISLDDTLPDPADAAVMWLTTNGYDVPDGSTALLGPYLEDGMYLLALRLTKGADSGSIRPIVLTYTGDEASIPIKLTAVAANADMGVLTWVLGESRAVPENYLSLELNEARINWFNAAPTYNAVVIEAADDAAGQGFVTEFAGSTDTFAQTVWTQFDDQAWDGFKGRIYQSFGELFMAAYQQYGGWDGFWDATRTAVTLPDTVPFEDFKLCPNCYAAEVTFSPATYLAELEKSVIQPVKVVQDLIDAHPAMSRLYTTLSAEEMTLDPVFTFNADLDDVSNTHSAERVIECSPNLFQFEAPWRIELPQGGVIRGTAQDTGTWPAALSDLPPNARIVRTGSSGSGKVVEDKLGEITQALDSYNESVPKPAGSAESGSDGGCSVANGDSSFAALLAAAALGVGALGRRRRR